MDFLARTTSASGNGPRNGCVGMWLSFRRKRVVAVGIPVPDTTVRTVDDDFAMLAKRGLARSFRRFGLGVVSGAHSRRAFAACGPPRFVRHYMDAF